MNIIPEPPAWWDLAVCRDMPGDLFFPESRHGTARAKAICARCPVAGECLADQLGYERATPMAGHYAGVFGGLSAKERAVILAAERREARETAASEREVA
jgi:WhiB family redox-sensing transcriptional regulator